MELRNSFVLILGIFLISLVSANGLVISPNSINVSKTLNEDYYLNLNIKNTETYEFKDIQFTDTLKANKFNLLSGENKTIQFKIDSNTNLNKTARIRGFFESNLGASNKTEIVNIYYPNGVDKCNLNLVVGDSITWKNNVIGDIKLKNTDTNEDIRVISANGEYTIKFNSQQSFNYQVLRIGIPFTQTCNINVMPTTGLVYNTDLDGLLNINLNITYPPTNLTSFFLQSSYNLSYNEGYSDVFSIRNTGDKIAKVTLSGMWVTFDKNNFEIEAGKSVNVGYVVKPIIYETSQTNQLYNSTIKVSGNFQEINQNLSIFVKYANVGTGIGNISALDPNVLQYLLDKICEDHPEFAKCKVSTSCANNTEKIVSTIFTEDSVLELLQRQANSEDIQTTFKTQQNELIANMTYSISNMSYEMKTLREENALLKDRVDNSNASTIFLGIMFVAIGVITCIVFLILKNKGKFKMFAEGNFHKGEKPL